MSVDTPVRTEDRLHYMDVLRGFAVMAIFIVNIKGMFQPFAYYMNASLWTAANDEMIAVLQAIFVDNKWRTIFTALFGAGLVLISEKADKAGTTSGGRLRRRLFFLLIFGLIHLIGIWTGDILTIYALAGFVAMLFRNMPLGKLTIWMAVILVIGTAWAGGFSTLPAFIDEFAVKMGGKMWGLDPEMLAKEREIFMGGPIDHVAYRGMSSIGFLVFYFLLGGFGLATVGIMLAGMVLFKSGFLKGQWSVKTYLIIAVLFLGGTWAVEYHRISGIVASGWNFETSSLYTPLAIVMGLTGAFGYAALIGLLVRLGIKFSPVAAAGRMAFTNYIACSLIGTTMAYGHGLGMYETLSLQQQMYLVGAVFLAILIWSPLWLSIFRFGPLEWLWRSLTYGKMQPLLKSSG